MGHLRQSNNNNNIVIIVVCSHQGALVRTNVISSSTQNKRLNNRNNSSNNRKEEKLLQYQDNSCYVELVVLDIKPIELLPYHWKKALKRTFSSYTHAWPTNVTKIKGGLDWITNNNLIIIIITAETHNFSTLLTTSVLTKSLFTHMNWSVHINMR